jgi:hypothetical protein
MGLALNCKINAAFVPVPLFLWGMWYRRRACAANLLALLALAPLVWIATWPWLWHATIERWIEYFEFHRQHAQTGNTVYFGEIYTRHDATGPPASYPFFYFLVSIPVAILLPAAWATLTGVADAVRLRGRPETALLLAALCVPLVVAALPGVPRYDGQRLFLTAFPFAACLAGVGFSRGIVSLAEHIPAAARPAASALAAALLLLSAAFSLWKVHPFQPYSYYNVLTRGPSGAFALGLSPVVWAMSDRSAAEYLRDHARPGETIYGATGATAGLKAYQRLGLLDPALRWGRRADWLVLEYNLAYSRWADWWPCYRDVHPWYRKVYEVKAAGAPVLGVFRARDSMWRDPSGKTPRITVKPPGRP